MVLSSITVSLKICEVELDGVDACTRQGLTLNLLLKLYYETLMANGVEQYSTGDLRRDFQAGLGAPLTTLVIARGHPELLQRARDRLVQAPLRTTGIGVGRPSVCDLS